MSEPQVKGHVTLHAYLLNVQGLIKEHLGGRTWVIAELTEFNVRSNGYCHMALIDAVDGKEAAKCTATMFASVANLQMTAFRSVTGSDPAPGMKVLLNVSASFHPQYGFKLEVFQLDGNYTLGEMKARVEQIVERLKAEGYYSKQKQLASPSGYWRVAVISPENAAGLGDFRQDADCLNRHGLVEFAYYDAVFQGEKSPASIKEALRLVFADHQRTPFDAVCLIRGGGAKADLAWLNDYSLAVWVCRIPIPVFTGIGHERDETILDLVAHTRFDTPSKVVGALMRHLQHEAQELQRDIDRSGIEVERLVSLEENRLQGLDSRYRHSVHQQITGAIHDFKDNAARFDAGIKRLLHEQALFLQRTQSSTDLLIQRLLAEASAKLVDWGQQYRLSISQTERGATEGLLHAWSEASSLMRTLLQEEITRYRQAYHSYQRLVPAMLSHEQTLLQQSSLRTQELSNRLLDQNHLELQHAGSKVASMVGALVHSHESDLNILRQRYASAVRSAVQAEEHRLDRYGALFSALDPRAVMAKGFALIKSQEGKLFHNAASVEAGVELLIQFHDGQVQATAGGRDV